MTATLQTSRLAVVRGGRSRTTIAPAYFPGRPWVSGLELDQAGTLLQVQVLNDAMAPTLPAGTWLSAWQVQAAGPLTPGLYLVRDGRPGLPSYIGRLSAEGLGSEQLVFDFDGVLPEPIICSLPRTGAGASVARLYRIQVLTLEPAAA